MGDQALMKMIFRPQDMFSHSRHHLYRQRLVATHPGFKLYIARVLLGMDCLLAHQGTALLLVCHPIPIFNTRSSMMVTKLHALHRELSVC